MPGQRHSRLVLPLVVAIALGMLAAPSATAFTDLDQSQESVAPAPYALYVPNGAAGINLSGEAQTFTAGVTGVLNSIQLRLYREAVTTLDLAVELRDASPAGALLASATVPVASVTTNPAGDWVTVKFAAPPAVTAGATYAIVLPVGVNTASADPTYGWGFSATDAYAAGTSWFYAGYTGPWTATPGGVDHPFRTFVTVGAPTCDVSLALVNGDLVDDALSVIPGQAFEIWGGDYPPLTAVTVTFTPTAGAPITIATTTDVFGEFGLTSAPFTAAQVGSWRVTAVPAAGCPATADAATLVVRAQRTVDRIFGADRYDTARKVSVAFFTPTTTTSVFVATGATFPDALAGGSAAAMKDGPILLVQQNLIPNSTREELLRLKPATIYVLGGPGAVSNAVQTQLVGFTKDAKATSVVRLGGADRYETAALISKALFPANVGGVLIATGATYPDALAGAAAGARYGMPVLLVTGTAIPAATATELVRLHPDEIYILGGTGAISAGVQTQLAQYTAAKAAADVIRLGGANRYETAVLISDWFFPSGLSPVMIATGLNFPDALAAGPAGRAVLLVPGSSVPVSVANEVRRLLPTDVFLLGGPTVVTDVVRTTLVATLQ